MRGYIFPKTNKKYEEYRKKDGNLNSQGFKKLWNYFLDIINTNSFIYDVKIIRKTYNIPKNGFKYTIDRKNNGMVIYDGNQWCDETRRFFSDALQNLCLKYELDPIMWENTMDNLITFNEIGEPADVSLCRDYDVEEEEDCLGEKFARRTHKKLNKIYPVFIKISPYASQRDIIDWIKKNFNTIKKLQDHYKRPGIKIGKSKTKNLQIKKRNEFIYKHRNMRYKDLVAKVVGQFPKEITDSIDEGSIGKIISLETKRRKYM